MQRMKDYWDELHPEHTYFNKQQLRQQATYVVSKGLVLETHLQHSNELMERHEENIKEVEFQLEIDTLEDEAENVENIDQNLVDEFKTKFLHYFSLYIDKKLSERNFNTPVITEVNDDEWKAINHVIDSFINERLTDINLWKLNVTQYAAILTILERHDMLKENTKTKGVKRIPRWRVFLEQKINNIRRKLSFVTLILKCQDDATPLTKHQLSISNKLKKWYRNTKTRTLRSQQSKLKHELVVTSQELRNRIKVKNVIQLIRNLELTRNNSIAIGRERKSK